MASLKIKTEIEIINDRGDKTNTRFTKVFSSLNEIYRQEVDISANGTVIVYDPTNWSGIQFTAFDALVMYSTKDLDIEMTINEGDANEELNSFRLAADTPFILGADDAYYNHSASNAFGGTLDVIDKIRVDEPNGSAAKLTLIMVD